MSTGALLPLLALSACVNEMGARVGEPPPRAEVTPAFVAVLSQGVTIYAEDASWVLANGDDPVPPPFTSDSLGLVLDDGKIELRDPPVDNEYKGKYPTSTANQPSDGDLARIGGRLATLEELLELHPQFLAAGAQRVRVQVPGRAKALYGVLALTPCVEDTDASSAKRSYRIQVPEARVQQALGAQIALVCQPYRARVPVVRLMAYPTESIFSRWQWKIVEYHHTAELECVTWILWISDAPFADHDPNWEPPG